MENKEKRMQALSEFEGKIGYQFHNIKLLDQALTHSSYVNGKDVNVPNYERLEFVGDSILGFIVGMHLFRSNKSIDEGKLTRVRANIVCEDSLYKVAMQLNMGEYIQMSRGEEYTGGRHRVSILADTVEAVLAAIYLDAGIDEAKRFVLTFFEGIISDAVHHRIFSDYKSFLQEYMQKNAAGEITYQLVREIGPDHDKTFVMDVLLNHQKIGNGKGKSKKDAQQAAAQDAIKKLGIKHE